MLTLILIVPVFVLIAVGEFLRQGRYGSSLIES